MSTPQGRYYLRNRDKILAKMKTKRDADPERYGRMAKLSSLKRQYKKKPTANLAVKIFAAYHNKDPLTLTESMTEILEFARTFILSE